MRDERVPEVSAQSGADCREVTSDGWFVLDLGEARAYADWPGPWEPVRAPLPLP